MNIAFFDFDGTITTRDTMFQFIRFSKGDLKFCFGILILLPVLLVFKAGFIPNWRAKEILFSFFFKGATEPEIRKLGSHFSMKKIPELIRPEAIDKLEFHKKSGDKIVIVSASFSFWVKPWCDDHQIELLATEPEIRDGKLTGLIQGKNCYGSEKVTQIREKYDLEQYGRIYAYGDSRGDFEMLNLADEKYMKWRKTE